MTEITGERFAELLAYDLKFPLFIKDDAEARKQQNVVLEIHCYDPDEKKEDELLKAATEALQEEDETKRMVLFEMVNQRMDQSNHVSYKVGEIRYSSKPQISNIEVKSDYDGKREELVIKNGESVDPLFVFLQKMSEDHGKRLIK
jgi:hypothetical protein